MAEMDWTKETPGEPTYDLSMYDAGGNCEQEVSLTRAEFIALKAHLVAMRRHTAGDPATLVAGLLDKSFPDADVSFPSDQYQVANQALTARAVYRLCPELVLTDAPAFVAALLKLADPET